MTLAEAISTEQQRYAARCANHDTHRAHVHFLAWQRLRHGVLTSADLNSALPAEVR